MRSRREDNRERRSGSVRLYDPRVPLSLPVRCAILGAVTLAAGILAFSLDPVPQSLAYHDFADSRAWLGVPNFGDVASNVPFLFTGAAGLAALRSARFADERERRAWRVFFAAVACVAAGSGWYHLAPANESLFWDRLPMSVAFGALIAALVTERIDARVGGAMLVPLVLASAGTVVWWRIGEARGHGDLRAYGLAQGLPMIWVVLVVALFPGRSTRAGDFVALFLWYALAKALEAFDGEVLRATGGIVSGHTLKHLAAAAGTWQLVRMARRTSAATEAGPAPAPRSRS